jgi:hypothetical protein
LDRGVLLVIQWRYAMRSDEFIRTLSHLSAQDLGALAARIRSDHESDDEMAWWRATLALDRCLRHQRRSVHSAQAAQTAAQAVFAAAGRAHLQEGSADIVAVANSAREVARALVADDADSNPRYFFQGWERFLTVGTAALPELPIVAA